MTTVASTIALAATCACADGPLPAPGVPLSCGVQLKTHNFTVETLDRIHELGFRIVRRGFYWGSVEKEQGAYDFADYDAPMARARELGLTVVGVLFGNHKLYEDHGQRAVRTDAGRQGFARFAAALAKHYQGQKVLWEVWNEPNVRTFWRGDGKHNSDEFAKEYVALVKEVAPAMLAVDSGCFVVAGSVSNYWEPSYRWTESCFRKGILKTGIRGWSVHPYGVKTPEEFAVGHARTRELLRKHGSPDLPILNTERGFAVKKTDEGWSGGSEERAREFQAWHFVRQFMVDQLHGVPLTVWYEWDGDAFGLEAKEETRPALGACRAMLAQLDGYQFARRIEPDSALDYVLLFENARGARKLVAWTAPPPGAPPDQAREHEVSVHLVKRFPAADLTGEKRTVSVRTDSIQLPLSGAPQYVTIPDDVELGRCASASVAPAAVRGPAGPRELNLFEEGVEWEFTENTGKGGFTLGRDDEGTPLGLVQYDFTKSRSKSTPYVLASAPVNIAEGATELCLNARSGIRQKLTFRLVDSTGQTHQYKSRIAGAGKWETIRIPLTRRLEHWGGAKDGRIHYPIKTLVFSVPLPDEAHRTGKVEYANIVVK